MEGRKHALDIVRKTLNLPKTKFPMRANACKREPEIRLQSMSKLYRWQKRNHALNKSFVLHDGPPFANGDLHMGHFLNKVLKDIMNRYALLRGKQIQYTPGWDCHGLPIEHKAVLELQKKGKTNISSEIIRKASHALASKALLRQKAQFQEWGILADWENNDYYATSDAQYEAKQYDIFRKMVNDGIIYRGLKPVYWSPSSRTALAESELEYSEKHVSTAAYVAFALHTTSCTVLQSFGNLQAVIWTTTPWTIPANMALAVHAEVEYAIVTIPNSDNTYLVAYSLLESFASVLGIENRPEVVEIVFGKEMVGSLFQHPLNQRCSPVVCGQHVTTDTGTGIVHTAPGHGMEDYDVWMKEGHSPRSVLSPVDESGHFTKEAGKDLLGLPVLTTGTAAVLEQLSTAGALLHSSPYLHRYPYDWRTKQPIIFRATRQWFATLKELQKASQKALLEVDMVPRNSRNRLQATISSRKEWCISRQRAWGLPIPVFYNIKTDEPLLTDETMAHVQDLVRQHGSQCWWTLSVAELLPPSLRSRAAEYVKGSDTLDVWFNSGSSWHAVLADNNKTGPTQADVYCEGSDQHRGWFQSSLLTAMSMQSVAPYKKLITHGFVLDAKDRKMSKSLGNVVSPADIINGNTKTKQPAYGVDVLRYWVASSDYTSDVRIGNDVVDKVSDALRKVRNTARFLLGNLNDFNAEIDQVPYADLSSVDQYLLSQLAQVQKDVEVAYESHAFNRVPAALAYFVTNELSGLYMEVCKDRLYCDVSDSHARRCAQTVLAHALRILLQCIAPIAVHTAEDIFNHASSQLLLVKDETTPFSIFQCPWTDCPSEWTGDAALHSDWKTFKAIRDKVNILMETARREKHIGSATEVQVKLHLPQQSETLAKMLFRMQAETKFEDLFLCSFASITHGEALEEEQVASVKDKAVTYSEDVTLDIGTVRIVVCKADGHKCPRCWKVSTQVDASEDILCTRCALASGVSALSQAAPSADVLEDSVV